MYKEHQNQDNQDTNILKTYTFKAAGDIVRISFIDANKKDLSKKIVDQNCDIFYNARLLMKKRQTMVDFNNLNSKDACAPTFHNKLMLFLFTQKEHPKEATQRKNTKTFIAKPDYAIEALEEWRIKEENMDHFSKMERECDIIKQEIESERIAFRNKVRTIEHYLGNGINIDKLVNEEED